MFTTITFAFSDVPQHKVSYSVKYAGYDVFNNEDRTADPIAFFQEDGGVCTTCHHIQDASRRTFVRWLEDNNIPFKAELTPTMV